MIDNRRDISASYIRQAGQEVSGSQTTGFSLGEETEITNVQRNIHVTDEQLIERALITCSDDEDADRHNQYLVVSLDNRYDDQKKYWSDCADAQTCPDLRCSNIT